MNIQSFSVTVLRPHYDMTSGPSDCTNGGVSATDCRFTVVLSDADGEALLESYKLRERTHSRLTTPILVLEKHRSVDGAIHLRPLKSKVSGWVMFGGNYAKGDSSFAEAVAKVLGTSIRMYDPVAIHDRVEG